MGRQREHVTTYPRLHRWCVTGLACLSLVFAVACGTPIQGNSQPSVGAVNSSPTTATPITATPGAATPPALASPPSATSCRVSQLAVSRLGLGAGMGQIQAAWSLTNTSSAPCTVKGGLPTLELDNAADHAVTTSHITPLKAVSSAPLTVEPGAKVWFFTDTLDDCPSGYQTLSGGPFSEVVILPGTQMKARWADNGLGLNHTTLPGQCNTMQVRESGLQTTEPTLQSEYGPTETPAATP